MLLKKIVDEHCMMLLKKIVKENCWRTLLTDIVWCWCLSMRTTLRSRSVASSWMQLRIRSSPSAGRTSITANGSYESGEPNFNYRWLGFSICIFNCWRRNKLKCRERIPMWHLKRSRCLGVVRRVERYDLVWKFRSSTQCLFLVPLSGPAVPLYPTFFPSPAYSTPSSPFTAWRATSRRGCPTTTNSSRKKLKIPTNIIGGMNQI